MTITELLRKTVTHGFAVQNVILNNKSVWLVFRIFRDGATAYVTTHVGELFLNPNDDTIIEFKPNRLAVYGDIERIQKALA